MSWEKTEESLQKLCHSQQFLPENSSILQIVGQALGLGWKIHAIYVGRPRLEKNNLSFLELSNSILAPAELCSFYMLLE